jgi:hypothetical protein
MTDHYVRRTPRVGPETEITAEERIAELEEQLAEQTKEKEAAQKSRKNWIIAAVFFGLT